MSTKDDNKLKLELQPTLSSNNNNNDKSGHRNLKGEIQVKIKMRQSLQQTAEEIQKELKAIVKQNKTLSVDIQMNTQSKEDYIKKIQNIDKQLKDSLQEQEEKQENLDRLLNIYKKRVKESLQQYLHTFLCFKKNEYSYKKLVVPIKLNFVSVIVYYLPEDMFKTHFSQFKEYDQVPAFRRIPNKQAFSINKQTQIGDILYEASIFWENEIKKAATGGDALYTLADIHFNDLSLLLKVPVEYFFLQNADLYSHAELILRPAPNQSFLLTSQNRSIVKQGQNDNPEQEIQQQKQEIKDLKECFHKFKEVMPGLALYESPDQEHAQEDEEEYNEKESAFKQFLIFIIRLTIIVLTISVIQRSSDFSYKTLVKLNICDDFMMAKKYQQINETIIWEKIFPYFNFVDKDENIIMWDRVVLGKIRVLNVRTKQKPCSFNIKKQNNKICNYPFYDGHTMSQETYQYQNSGDTDVSFPDTWRYWQSSNKTQMGPFYALTDSVYDGSGYMYDIDPYQSKENFQKQLKILRENNWIDEQTKLIVFSVNYYDFNRKIVQSYEYYLEMLNSGGIYEDFNISIFQLKHMDDPQVKQFYLYDLVLFIIVLLWCAYSLFHSFALKFQRMKKKAQNDPYFKISEHLRYFLDFPFFLNLFNILVNSLYFAMTYIYNTPQQSLKEILSSEEYINLIQYGLNLDIALQYFAISFFIMTIQILSSFAVTKSVKSTLAVVQYAIDLVIYHLIFIWTIVAGYSIIYQHIYGPYSSNFRDFIRSYQSINYLFFFGDFGIQQSIDKVDRQSSLVMAFIFIITISFGVSAVFVSISVESFRVISNIFDRIKDTPTKSSKKKN